jgi:hypothetical protein
VGSVPPFSHVFYLSRVILSRSPVSSEATMPGSSLSSSLPPLFLLMFPPVFPPHGVISGPSLPHPIAHLSPSSLFSISLHTAPPRLSPLIFISVVSPRLPFTSTFWMLIPPLLMTSAHVLLVEVLLGYGWWEFFPRRPFFVIRVFSCTISVLLLSASSVSFFHCIAFPSTVFQPSVSTGAVAGALGRAVF